MDSLEKRVDSYINENIELKKRLEELEINNKTLLAQLQKMQTTINQSNTNQFGTILMVVVLFFAVVLGVWSPLLTKDQMSSSNTAAANTANVAAAKAANPPSTSTTTENALKAVVENDEIRPFSPYATPNLKSRVLLAVDDELMSFDLSGGGGCNGGSNNGIGVGGVGCGGGGGGGGVGGSYNVVGGGGNGYLIGGNSPNIQCISSSTSSAASSSNYQQSTIPTVTSSSTSASSSSLPLSLSTAIIIINNHQIAGEVRVVVLLN